MKQLKSCTSDFFIFKLVNVTVFLMKIMILFTFTRTLNCIESHCIYVFFYLVTYNATLILSDFVSDVRGGFKQDENSSYRIQ